MNELLDRIGAVAKIIPDGLNPHKRLQAQAEQMDRAVTLGIGLNTATASLVALAGILFNRDGDRFVNMDTLTRRILIPVPWGSRGWKRWGLRKWEGECLRHVLIGRVVEGKPSLFYLSGNVWSVARGFDDKEKALRWIHNHGPTLQEWHDAVTAHNDYYRELMAKRRATLDSTL